MALQDVRIWGSVPQIFKTEGGNTFLSEAWGQYQFSDQWSLKAGRQIISYDNQRFLGGLEWAQQGRRHDAVLFKYENPVNKSKFHIGLAFNNDNDVAEPAFIQAPGANFYSVGGNYKSLQYGWYNKKFSGGGLSVLVLNAGLQNQDSTVSYKQTYGLIGSKKVGGVKLGGDFYYQGGSLGGNTVNAFLVGAYAGFTAGNTPITIGAEYISGKDDDDATTDVTNFSPDFGTNHAHNGFMDYFFVGPANGNVGVTDLYLKSSFKVGKGSLKVHLHEFLTGSTQLDQEGNQLSSAMGTEVDFVYGMKLTESVSLAVGYSHMFATDTMLALRPGDQKSNNWSFLMITFKPAPVKLGVTPVVN